MKKNIYTEDLINLFEAKNAKQVFDSLEGRWNERSISGAYRKGGFTEYGDLAEDVLKVVVKYGEGFVVDICDKALNKQWELSTKQRWCVAFAFINIAQSEVKDYAAEVEAMMAEYDKAESVESETAEVETESHEGVAAETEAVVEALKTLPVVSKKSRKSKPQNTKIMDKGLPQISIDEVVKRVRDGHPIVRLSLKDASRYIANVQGELSINSTTFYSARVREYCPGDEIVPMGKKRFNVSELRRILEGFRGKGAVSIWDGGEGLFYGEIA